MGRFVRVRNHTSGSPLTNDAATAPRARRRAHPDGALLLHKIALLAAALLADVTWAQAAKSTKVYAVTSTYIDTRSFKSGPEKLYRVLGKVRDYYAEGSGGAHEFLFKVRPTTLELLQTRPSGKCQLPDKAKLSTALSDAGITLDGYQALVLIVPPSALGCPGGIQTAFAHPRADGSVRAVPLAIAWSLTERYIAHEILHTHGLGHANTLVCRKASLAVNCKTREYGNVWDLMGHDAAGFEMLAAPLRVRMGWTEPILHVSGRATYTIGAATKARGLPTTVAVKLPFAGSETIKLREPLTLWIEYRAPHGFDSRMARSRYVGFAEGAMVHLTGSWQGSAGNKTRKVSCPLTSPCLLDANPQTATFDDAGLGVGQSWTEPFTGTRLTVESHTDTTLTVRVSTP